MKSPNCASSADLSHNAAILADANRLVRARFVEAADTMAYAVVHGWRPMSTSGLWPAYSPEYDDEEAPTYRPSRAAISRADEVQDWLIRFTETDDAERRILLARWSASLAVPKMVGSFRSWCKKTGRVRRTAERRVDAAFQDIAASLLQNPQSLRVPDLARVSPLLPEWGRDIDMVAERVREHGPLHWQADDARPVNLPEERDTSWAERQNERRQAKAERTAREKAA